MNYYYRGNFIGDEFGPGRYSQIMESMATGQALYERLRKLGVDYFLVNLGRAGDILPRDASFDARFDLLYRDAAVAAYVLK